jgi:hypothetical protein
VSWPRARPSSPTARRCRKAAALREAGADHVYRGPTEVALGILPAIRASLAGELPAFLDALHAEHGKLEERAEVMD